MRPPPPALCYHRVGGPLELGVTRVGRRVFERQMRALARAGWTTLTLEQYAARLTDAVPPDGRALFLSFDDGYTELAAHAYPVLADLGFTAVTFLVTDYVGRENGWDVQYTRRPLRHLDWDAAARWRARGFEFGSHTATHPRLTWLGDAQVRDELARSRATLTARLGAGAGRALAYPFGAADARVERLAREAGYGLGFGGVRAGGASAFALPRVPVYFWDLGNVPFGARSDPLGAVGQFVAHVANRCAVGTSVIRRIRRMEEKRDG